MLRTFAPQVVLFASLTLRAALRALLRCATFLQRLRRNAIFVGAQLAWANPAAKETANRQELIRPCKPNLGPVRRGQARIMVRWHLSRSHVRQVGSTTTAGSHLEFLKF